MTRALPRTNFNSSRLIRLLADLAIVDTTEPGPAFAERLGLWLDFTDAISLFAALNEHTNALALADGQTAAPTLAGVAVDAEFARVRARMAQLITLSCSPGTAQARIKWPIPKPDLPIEFAADYEPFRRFYLAHQRDIESSARQVRANVRDVLAQASPSLKKLADLDAALDQILSERESKLLASVASLLEQRFEYLLNKHQQSFVDRQQTDSLELWMLDGAWLARFRDEMQTVLLAELDVRLQPALGLIEAFGQEITKHQ